MARHVPYDDPGTPDVRSPWRYLWWLVLVQRGRVLAGAWWGSLSMCGLILPPYLISRAVEDGVRGGDRVALLWWCGALLATAVGLALVFIARHRTMTLVRTDASLRTAQIVVRHVTRLGGVVRRKLSTGELTYLQNGDTARIAHALTSTGPGVGAVVAYVATAVLLVRISPLVAVVVLLGVPVLAVVTGPVLSRLHAVEAGYRQRQGELSSRAGDIVGGLRVLSGIGGKPAFEARFRAQSREVLEDGYRVSAWLSWVQALTWGLPALFLAVVTWIVARMVVSGAISIEEMLAVYLYVTTLTVPVGFFMEGADAIPRALVSARRVIDVLRLQREEDGGDAEPLDVKTGALTVVISANATLARAAVERLPGVVADNDDYLFAGTVREAVSVAVHGDHELDEALYAAAAVDVVEALPDGLDSHLESQGRNVSGGQRQRLRLVRALLSEPELLVLVEPTSALDAVTEAAVAKRVRERRTGRTTVVVSSSPLWAGQADQVVHLEESR
ncbi:ABC transporter transmembrane domain-containing protein [Lentzea flaviverrucosa]|uniref:ABC-type multidrug transport system, ATPase and permease component n=1 Tax=Lentzea flaviverrucosa TaxID=200379 RepID=A0A1H9RN83_9PSEU|nr:ABC transporter ATP-binding protein [Lentzea flaviverrucosa]RDI33053.1 ABC-type multidrug transport system fused ATPase/permease subunit [Lentzea flaviverrucosa]SER73369.1 ABC-type multidrug transport system, ATPase and permease component [Lentzea flaviverrucosa]